jgi:uncharacterized protein
MPTDRPVTEPAVVAPDLTRRQAVAALTAGFALAVQPVSAATITTGSEGLEAGEVEIPTLEGAIPDLAAKRIIDAQVTPAFRAGDYASGLNAAVDQLAALIRGEALPEPASQGTGGRSSGDSQNDPLALIFFAVLFIGPFFVRVFGRKVGPLVAATGSAVLGWWLTASVLVAIGGGLAALFYVALVGMRTAQQGWSSGGSSGSSSGGWGGGGSFSSGGGGDFGGGGASGNW